MDDKARIQEKIMETYVPLRELIFEDNERKIDIMNNFTDYSHVLAGAELIIYGFITANPKTKDVEVLSALKRIRRDPLQGFSHSEVDALAFAITYGMSRGLQGKRLAINEIRAVLDWLIYEVEGRINKRESYIQMLKKFFKVGLNKNRTGDKK